MHLIEYILLFWNNLRSDIISDKRYFIRRLLLSKNFNYIFFMFLFLVVFGLASYKINPFDGITSYGDGTYLFGYKDLSLWQQNLSNGIGRENAIFLYVHRIIFAQFFSLIGLNHNYISYLNWFLPIFFCFVVYFVIGYKLTKNYFVGFIAGLLIIFANQSIEYLMVFPEPYFYAISVIGIYLYISKNIYDHLEINWKQIISIISLSLLLVHPFFLLIAVLYWVVFLIFFLFNKYSIENLYKVHAIFFGVLLINSYWIIPFIASIICSHNTPANLYSQGNLDAVYSGYLEQGKITNILQGWTHPNIGSYVTHINNLINILFMFFLWGLFILTFTLAKKDNKFQLILSFILVLFLSLSFAPNNPLIAPIWDYLWRNVNVFSFFRSFSRFSIILLPLIVFISISSFGKIKKWQYKNYFLAFLLFFIIISGINVFTGDFCGTLPQSYNIPESYQKFNDEISKDGNVYSIIRYPYIAYEGYTWNKNSGIDYFTQSYYLSEYYLNKNIIYNKAAFNLNEKNEFYKKLFPRNFDNNGQEILNALSRTNGKYIMVNNDFIDILAENRSAPVSSNMHTQLFSNNGFELFEKNNEFAIYTNSNYLPIVYAKNSSFQKIYDTKYKIYMTQMETKTDLNFLVNNNAQWKLYLKKNPTNSWCQKLEYYQNTQTIECKHTNDFFEGEELSYLFNKPIFDETHKLLYEYANVWTVDPEYIMKNYPPEYYIRNPDGSIDVEIVLYFKPQSYLYIGLIISAFTLIGCMFYLIYDWRRERQIKKWEYL